MQSRRTSRTALAVVIAVLGLLLAGLVTPATAAPAVGGLKGTVTIGGAPVGFAKVQVYRFVSEGGEYSKPVRLKTDNTDSRGRYSFTGLAVRASYHYSILVTDRTGRSVKTFRGVTPRSGRTITKNVHLKAAAVLTGTVTRADGGSPADLTVAVDIEKDEYGGSDYDVFYPEGRTSVRADGTFTLNGLPAGVYERVVVSGGPYAEQCLDVVAGSLADCASNDPASSARQSVQLASGETRALPTVTTTKLAPPLSTVTGTVTDTSGKALKGIQVTVRPLPGGAGAGADAVLTRSSGRFTVPKVTPGTYVVRFDDPGTTWAKQYLGGGVNQWTSQLVQVADGQPIRLAATKLKSNSTARFATKAGQGSAKVAVQIKRTASGSAPSGRFYLSYENNTSTSVAVVDGRASVTLAGLPKGIRKLRATYSGTSSTAGFEKTVTVTVK